MIRGSIAVMFAAALGSGSASSLSQAPVRPPDVHYAPTRHAIADAMLSLAAVGADDVVSEFQSSPRRSTARAVSASRSNRHSCRKRE